MAMAPLHNVPAVVLGLLLNILDGVSYGMITFPTSMPIFASFGGDGVSMFFVTCIISQLVYTLGGSIFKGGNGSMMIEVVPFYHILVKVIVQVVGDNNPTAVISTTMVAFALSSLLTGLLFTILGALRLGVLIGYFPRHILVGCIGGVGVFLVETGLAVAARLEGEDGFKYNMETLRALSANTTVMAQWLFPLGLALLLQAITARWHHPLIMPLYFFVILVVFYTVAFLFRATMKTLWDQGWVFDIQHLANAPFYRFYTYFDFHHVSWEALWATLPTQMALVFFGILHVPLNVPALGVSLSEDNVDTDQELVAHGISNMCAGLLGTVPNYLCYVNSVLFYRVGGGSRLSGLMLAGATTIVLLLGPGMIGYLPIMVVGALIFVLGLDLVREALWDTIGRVNRLEYVTIVIIVVVMTLSDFVVGSLVGILLACLIFVMQSARRNVVRAVFTGHAARSTVRRQLTQRRFLDEVGWQTQVVKLHGSIFFGTINGVERLVRQLLDLATWKKNPIRFLVMDVTLVSHMDFSAAEAMTRIHRMLSSKEVHLVFAGLSLEGDVAQALRRMDLWAKTADNLEVFASLNEALEWTENEYLRGLYSSNLTAGKALRQMSMADTSALRMPNRNDRRAIDLGEGVASSPRYQHLHQAAKQVTQDVNHPTSTRVFDQDALHRPYVVLTSTLGPYMEEAQCESLFRVLVPELKELFLKKDTVLWDLGDTPDALYFIESGMLKARYIFSQGNNVVYEAMLAGTVAGELTFLSQQKRNAHVYAEMDTRVWRLDKAALDNVEKRDAQAYGLLIQILLRVTADEQDCLMSYLVSRLS
ncbi:hypothetical protein MNAN1_001535 [Malassezia nana]|uniref:Uncharacterized protein n=1 Tax=Malassezia nana TaxID=180528 RepID=A0AAF0EQV1_9BASI|nr:hypothetical protein MNAN1_001535 [Malassezia nana]